MSLARALATVGGLTLVSRVAGFVRDMLQAAVLGAGIAGDVFVIALRLPNLFRALFAEGALAVSFVPLYSEIRAREGLSAALNFAARTLGWLTLVLGLITLAAEWAMPHLIAAMAVGYADKPEILAQATELTRITFPYLLLISQTALLGAVLNAHDRFAPFAFAPVLFNLFLIAALLLAQTTDTDPTMHLAWGVLLSGFGQLVWLGISIRRAELGGAIAPRKLRLTPHIRRLGALFLPGLVGAGAAQINIFVGTMIATDLGEGAVSQIYYADRLNQLPLAVIGIALGTALLPMLARHAETDDRAGERFTQSRGFEMGLLLGLPCAVGLGVAALPIVRALFERGAFDKAASEGTAEALAMFAVGIPAYVLLKVVNASFFARQDTRTPVIVGALSSLINIALAWTLGRLLGLGPAGVALASSLSIWSSFIVGATILARRGRLVVDPALRRRAPRLILATLAMALAAGAVVGLTLPWLDRDPAHRLAALALVVGTGALVYAGAALLLRGAEPAEIRRWFRRTAGGA